MQIKTRHIYITGLMRFPVFGQYETGLDKSILIFRAMITFKSLGIFLFLLLDFL